MIAQMIESIMYFGIGFLLAALSVLVVAPLVHGRAMRLTMRRLKAAIPLSMAEVQADKDLQRAEFAVSTRRLETKVEQLRTKSAGQLVELGRKGDAINRLKIELYTLRDQLSATEEKFAVKTGAALDAQRSLSELELARLKSELDERSSITNVQKIEIIALKVQVEALHERLTAVGKKLKAEGGLVPPVPRVPMDFSQSAPPNNQHHERDVVPLVPKDWPTTERAKVPMDSSQSPPPNNQHHEGDVVPLMPKNQPMGEEARSSGPARDPNTGRDESVIGMARKRSDFSASLRVAEPSIRVFPRTSGFKNDQFASDRSSIRRRTFRTVARFSIVALFGVGGLSAWQYHGDEAMVKIRIWAPSLGWLASVSTTKSPAAPAAAAATSPGFVQQLEAIPRNLAVVRRSLEQLTDKQEQMARNIATLQTVEQDIQKKKSSPHLQRRAKLTPWPETRPTTIAGWTLRGISNGTAVLEGPNGIWRAMRGDAVPGVGRVESMVRWGGRLIVGTSRGLISTP